MNQQHISPHNYVFKLQGQAFINGFNLGRYWPVLGPQVTLYVPGTVWKTETTNQTVILLELENAPCFKPTDNCTITFQNIPNISKGH